MQSQYTDKARTALILAEKAARKLKQNYVGTEHILLGLLEEGTGVAARVLIENGANELEIREMIEDLIAPVSETPVKERDGYSPRAMSIQVPLPSHRDGAYSAFPLKRRGECGRKITEYLRASAAEAVYGYTGGYGTGARAVQRGSDEKTEKEGRSPYP